MEQNEVRKSLIAVAVVLAVGAGGGMVASAFLASRAYNNRGEQVNKSTKTMNVTGSARRRIISDLAVWRITVLGEGPDLKSSFNVLKEGQDRIIAFLNAKKFTDSEMKFGAIDTKTHYKHDSKGNETREIDQYSLQRSITITSSRLDVISAAASEVTELIKDGVLVISSAPEYHYTKLGDLKIEMIGEASKDARARADQIASNAGCVVTEVRNARMGVLQITPPNSTEVSDSGINDISSIDKDVTSVVSLTLGLETR